MRDRIPFSAEISLPQPAARPSLLTFEKKVLLYFEKGTVLLYTNFSFTSLNKNLKNFVRW